MCACASVGLRHLTLTSFAIKIFKSAINIVVLKRLIDLTIRCKLNFLRNILPFKKTNPFYKVICPFKSKYIAETELQFTIWNYRSSITIWWYNGPQVGQKVSPKMFYILIGSVVGVANNGLIFRNLLFPEISMRSGSEKL